MGCVASCGSDDSGAHLSSSSSSASSQCRKFKWPPPLHLPPLVWHQALCDRVTTGQQWSQMCIPPFWHKKDGYWTHAACQGVFLGRARKGTFSEEKPDRPQVHVAQAEGLQLLVNVHPLRGPGSAGGRPWQSQNTEASTIVAFPVCSASTYIIHPDDGACIATYFLSPRQLGKFHSLWKSPVILLQLCSGKSMYSWTMTDHIQILHYSYHCTVIYPVAKSEWMSFLQKPEINIGKVAVGQ